MQRRAVAALALLVSGCGALAGRGREENANAPVILPPMEGPGEEPTPVGPTAPARSRTLSLVPMRAGDVWTGQYVCQQGAVNLTVRVQGAESTHVTAVFETAAGRWDAAGEYDPDSGALELQPSGTVAAAPGAAMPGLYGTVSDGGAVYEGRVTDPTCRWFSLRR